MTREDAQKFGWEADPISLYDGDGVEGWRMTGPEGQEYTEIGSWCEDPPWPDEFIKVQKVK